MNFRRIPCHDDGRMSQSGVDETGAAMLLANEITAATNKHEVPYGLLVKVGEHKGKVFPLCSTRFVVGRGEKCDLRLQSHRVSRAHSVFVPTQHGVVFSNLGNRNPAKVNGERVLHPTKLRLGDQIDICSFIIELVMVVPPEPTTSQPSAE